MTKERKMNATATAPVRQRKPRPKPERRVRLCVRPQGDAPGVVRIRVGTEQADYFLTLLAVDFGRGFKVEKIGHADAYHVNIDGDRKTCDCKGHTRHSHCKHSDGLAALIAAGRL